LAIAAHVHIDSLVTFSRHPFLGRLARHLRFMIELNAEIPFLWRLSPESSEGYCSVSLVVPRPPENEVPDLTIETTILSLASDSLRSEQEETLEWNEEDISLFLRLLSQKKPKAELESVPPEGRTLRVDLSDPDVIEIINIVAAAGFGVAFTSTGLLRSPSALLRSTSSQLAFCWRSFSIMTSRSFLPILTTGFFNLILA